MFIQNSIIEKEYRNMEDEPKYSLKGNETIQTLLPGPVEKLNL